MKKYLLLLTFLSLGCSMTQYNLETVETMPVYGEQGIGAEQLGEIEPGDTIMIVAKPRKKLENVMIVVHKSRLVWTVGVPHTTKLISRKRISRKAYLSQYARYTFASTSEPNRISGSTYGSESSSKPYGSTSSRGATIHTGPRGGRYYINQRQ
ncbi:hypothetical protein [Dyadobacter sp. CY326]|uniref:hypothetical protein n=1 Tax=Dyadobacter sp. CY326 TaxID=2907300 RepID=UPI001F2AA45F|nr:hypothetical protein [Dyadobacter sp. CY326]MCE7066153.1 hypothetical protein [Dyadobacter sp. CY326]